jgi:catechol 2,3-dioxygenase-like lactoylglutathione lyase family enzyme
MPALSHVALAVADPDRSLRFYRDIVAVEGDVQAKDYGFVINTSTGVTFTLFRGRPPSTVGDFHIGVDLPDGDAVREARTRFRSMGVVEHEWIAESDYVSVKIEDPDGYLVEISWEPPDMPAAS